jgi:hypothetical protein
MRVGVVIILTSAFDYLIDRDLLGFRKWISFRLLVRHRLEIRRLEVRRHLAHLQPLAWL